jgi:hypothetical protein
MPSRLAALDMKQPLAYRRCAITLGADKGYDAADFVEELRTLNVRPHVAQSTSGRQWSSPIRRVRRPAHRNLGARIARAIGRARLVGDEFISLRPVATGAASARLGTLTLKTLTAGSGLVYTNAANCAAVLPLHREAEGTL